MRHKQSFDKQHVETSFPTPFRYSTLYHLPNYRSVCSSLRPNPYLTPLPESWRRSSLSLGIWRRSILASSKMLSLIMTISRIFQWGAAMHWNFSRPWYKHRHVWRWFVSGPGRLESVRPRDPPPLFDRGTNRPSFLCIGTMNNVDQRVPFLFALFQDSVPILYRVGLKRRQLLLNLEQEIVSLCKKCVSLSKSIFASSLDTFASTLAFNLS